MKDRESALNKMSRRSEVALYYLAALCAQSNQKQKLVETIEKISFDKIHS